MWLINTSTLRLEEVLDGTQVEYAILSHRWQEDEVLFEDTNELSQCHKAGAAKLLACCKIAEEYGLQFMWIDTCCIDKKSSSELQEAINSMFGWYSEATLCFAYLYDVHSNCEDSSFDAEFRSSIWFTRCWTLQELLAPRADKMLFFNSSWQPLGSKHKLINELSQITGIDISALSGQPLHEYSIAERMFWASSRYAQRIEDQAYSLLGIFNINMPMLYGEGLKAFQRLCEVIIAETDDETIFAWSEPNAQPGGLLARSPAAYISCKGMKPTVGLYERDEAFVLTSRGLKCRLRTVELSGKSTYTAFLNAAFHEPECLPRFMGIFLERLDASDYYVRCNFAQDNLVAPKDRWEGTYLDMSSLYSRLSAPSIQTVLVRHKGFTKTAKMMPRLSLMLPHIEVLSRILTPIDRFEFAAGVFEDKHPIPKLLPDPQALWTTSSRGIAMPFEMFSTMRFDKRGPLCNIYLAKPFYGVKLIQIGISPGGMPMVVIVGDNLDEESSSADNTSLQTLREIQSFQIQYSRLPSAIFVKSVNNIASKAYTGLYAFVADSPDEDSIYFVSKKYSLGKNVWITWAIRFKTIRTPSQTYIYLLFRDLNRSMWDLKSDYPDVFGR